MNARTGTGSHGSGGPVEPQCVRYAVLSTVRNEEQFIGLTAESLVGQTLRPSAWLVIDDGSTDKTAQIIGDYARSDDWIRLVSLDAASGSNRCSRVMRAFLFGYSLLEDEFDFVIKVDGDVSFDADHIECLLQRFGDHPRLGIASGSYREPVGQGWKVQDMRPGYAMGAVRAYRAECLRFVVDAVSAIGGPAGVDSCPNEPRDTHELPLSWDSIDHLYAEEDGWETRSFPELVVTHHRTEGARTHVLTGQFEQGMVSYAMGYHPLFAVGRGVRRMAEYPYIVGGVALTMGYLWGVFSRNTPRADAETRRLVRQRHSRRLRHLAGAQGPDTVRDERPA